MFDAPLTEVGNHARRDHLRAMPSHRQSLCLGFIDDGQVHVGLETGIDLDEVDSLFLPLSDQRAPLFWCVRRGASRRLFRPTRVEIEPGSHDPRSKPLTGPDLVTPLKDERLTIQVANAGHSVDQAHVKERRHRHIHVDVHIPETRDEILPGGRDRE